MLEKTGTMLSWTQLGNTYPKMRFAFLVAQEMRCGHHKEWLPVQPLEFCRAMFDSKKPMSRTCLQGDCTGCACKLRSTTVPVHTCLHPVHTKDIVIHPGCTWTMSHMCLTSSVRSLRNNTSNMLGSRESRSMQYALPQPWPTPLLYRDQSFRVSHIEDHHTNSPKCDIAKRERVHHTETSVVPGSMQVSQ